MARKEEKHTSSYEENSIAQTHKSAKDLNVNIPRRQAEGYGILGAAIILFLYAAFGFLENILDFVFAIAAIGLALYGAQRANLFEQVQKLWQYLFRKYNK